jgi:hypothetical protein
MIALVRELFERLAAELPAGSATVNVIVVENRNAAILELRPANAKSASVSVHTDGSDLLDFSFGFATWEFPYERRYRLKEKDLLAEIEEMSRAVIAGRCEVARRLFWTTSRIHVAEYTYSVTDVLTFSLPLLGTQRFTPYAVR